MPGLFVENLSKSYVARGSMFLALDNLTLQAETGELLVLLGPSGSGKTTLLRLIAGLDEPSSGRILLNDQSLAGIKPHLRSIGMAFQQPALLPQLTVQQNITLGPRLRGASATERSTRSRELAGLLGIAHLSDRFPETLSGGEQQRVSLARALANQPDLLLLDEPLANLDPVSRHELRDAIRAVQQKLRVTVLYVTHDQSEAASLGDRIAIIRNGSLQQLGTSPELYSQPANLFVAQFFGPERPNTLNGEIRNGLFRPSGTTLALPTNSPHSGPATCIIRPTAFQPGDNLGGTIKSLHHTGWNTLAFLDLSGVPLNAILPPSPDLRVGNSFQFNLNPSEIFFFYPSGDRLRTA